jgi:putative addiction module CopG family antidote
MAHTLTDYSQEIIQRLIRSGRYNNQSEVVRAALRTLEEKEFGYLNPPPLKESALARAYRTQGQAERAEERAAAQASRRRKPRWDE